MLIALDSIPIKNTRKRELSGVSIYTMYPKTQPTCRPAGAQVVGSRCFYIPSAPPGLTTVRVKILSRFDNQE